MKKIIYLYIISLLLIIFVVYTSTHKFSEAPIIPKDSLCSSFIGSVKYDSDREVCRLPCNAKNLYKMTLVSDNEDCPKFKPPIAIEKNKIKALINTEVSQYIRKLNTYKVQTVKLKKKHTINLKSEIIRTKSSYSKNGYDWFLKFIPKPVEEIMNKNKLSVNLILLDAASRYVARKQLPITLKTLQSISSKYSTYDMLRYHTIDRNSDPQYPPLFYGINQTEGKNNNRIIFEDYKEEGYKTFNSVLWEDPLEKLSANNEYTGSDHNINYLHQDPKYNNVKSYGQFGNHARCVGHRQIHKYVFEYLTESVKYYHDRNQPTFSLTVLLDSHDYWLLSLPRIDKDLSNYITFLHQENILNDSVLIIFSDHGMHYGPYKRTEFGTFDHSIPLMFIIFPKWFSKLYPNIDKNLKINQNRFVTGYDFHATLFDIVHFGKNKTNHQNKRGISLFKEIPKSRNCHEFHVLFGCSCNMTKEYLNVP